MPMFGFPGASVESHIGEVGTPLSTPSYTFTRPADTTQYAVGDLVANNTTAANVVPMWWFVARVSGGSFQIARARIKKSTTSLTSAQFRVHFYAVSPAPVNGDNGVWSTPEATWLGRIDVTVDEAFSDSSKGIGMPDIGGALNVKLAAGQVIYGLLEARATYTPGNAEVFTVELEVLQN